MKVCKTCGKDKELSKFVPSKTGKGGYTIHCRVCLNKLKKIRPGFKNEKRRYKLKQYGLTIEDYDLMLKEQGGKCGICRSSIPGMDNDYFCVDHDHITGKVRGLLCGYCNIGLGNFRDSENNLFLAIDYLKKSY